MKMNVSKQICHEEYIFKTAYFIKVDFKEYIFSTDLQQQIHFKKNICFFYL